MDGLTSGSDGLLRLNTRFCHATLSANAMCDLLSVCCSIAQPLLVKKLIAGLLADFDHTNSQHKEQCSATSSSICTIIDMCPCRQVH